MGETEQKAIHLWVLGDVQGVGFRAYTAAIARNLGLTGWVRNLPNGQVEIWAEGTEEALRSLWRAVYDGPPAAEVEQVQGGWTTPTGTYTRFDIVYSRR